MVKTFTAQSPSTLEAQINTWITNNKVNVKQIQYQTLNDENYQYFTAMLLYEAVWHISGWHATSQTSNPTKQTQN